MQLEKLIVSSQDAMYMVGANNYSLSLQVFRQKVKTSTIKQDLLI